MLLKLFLETEFYEYLSKDQFDILNSNLKQTHLTKLKLKSIEVEMDYRWILIRPKGIKFKFSIEIFPVEFAHQIDNIIIALFTELHHWHWPSVDQLKYLTFQ